MTTVSLLFLNRRINERFQLCIAVPDVIRSIGWFPGRWRERAEHAPALPQALPWAGKRAFKVSMEQTRVRFLLGKARADCRALAPLPVQKLTRVSLLKVGEDYRC